MATLGPKNLEFAYRFDNECPACDKHAQIDEATDGEMYECSSCGTELIAVAYEDDIMRLHIAEEYNEPDDLSIDDQSPLCDPSFVLEDEGVIPW